MAALIVILALTAATLVGLRQFAPPAVRSSLGRREFSAAMALPILASLAHFYAVFAVGLIAIIAGFPALFGGAVDRQSRLEQQLRLGCFALPLLPIFYRDVTISSFTITQLNYVVLVCGILASAMLTSGARLANARLATWDITFAAMMLAQLFMDVRGNDFLFMLRWTLQIMLTLGLPYFVFSRAMAISKDPTRLLLALIMSTAIIAMIAIFESTNYWLLYNDMTTAVGANPDTISGYTKQRGGMLRPGATWADSTSLSLFFAIMLTMLYAIRREVGSRRFVWILAGMLVSGLFMTFARVGYVAAVAGFAACFAYERRYGRLALLAIALPVSAYALLELGRLVPILGASLGLAEDASDTFSYREMLLRDGLALWRENWLIGVSLPEVLFKLDHLRQGEGIVDLVNQPLQILMRGGILFALVYYAITIRLLAALFNRRRRLDAKSRAIASATVAGLVTLLVGSFTTNLGRNDSTFVILLAIGAGTLARRIKASAPASVTIPGSAATATT